MNLRAKTPQERSFGFIHRQLPQFGLCTGRRNSCLSASAAVLPGDGFSTLLEACPGAPMVKECRGEGPFKGPRCLSKRRSFSLPCFATGNPNKNRIQIRVNDRLLFSIEQRFFCQLCARSDRAKGSKKSACLIQKKRFPPPSPPGTVKNDDQTVTGRKSVRTCWFGQKSLRYLGDIESPLL